MGDVSTHVATAKSRRGVDLKNGNEGGGAAHAGSLNVETFGKQLAELAIYEVR